MNNVGLNSQKPNLPRIVDRYNIVLNTKEGRVNYESGAKHGFILPAIIAEGIKQYSTNDNPNITEDEQYFFKTGIFEKYMQVPDIQIHRTSGYETSGEVVRDANYSAFERFMEYYSDERSDGGKDITPNEYTKIMTSFLEANYWVTKSVLQNENGNDKSFWKFW